MSQDTGRLILAVALSALVLYVWTTYFYPKPQPKPAGVERTEASGAVPVDPTLPSTAGPTGSALSEPVLSPPHKSPAESTQAAQAVEEILVEVRTPLYTALISNLGPSIKSLRLRQFKEALGEDSDGVEVVHPMAKGNGIQFYWYPLPQPVHFSPSTLGPVRISADGSKTLVFSSAQGLRVDLEFRGHDYSMVARLTKAPSGNAAQSPQVMGILAYGPKQIPKASRTSYHRPVMRLGGKVRREWKDIDKALKYEAARDFGWGGFEELYFLQAFWSEADSADFGVRHDEQVGLVYATAPLTSGQDQAAIHLYLGPKDNDLLKTYGISLEHVIDLGWFGFIALPFYWLLKFFQGFVHNWGLAIIILTILMRVVLFPINQISYKSMKRMQEVQPLMTELRAKYKDKPEDMNKALFALYKTHKINPMSGCIPMLAQFPVFIALYNVLLNAIELRHAPFYWWIQDLSAKDPYYITPIVMGGTMYLQQMLSPTTPDPRTKMMMYMMPAVFTFMFLSFPSGLVIYWLVSNVLGIAQQYLQYRGTPKAALPKGVKP